jgi:DNA-binding NtrC family response regulator
VDLTSIKQRFGIIGNSPELNYALSVAVRVAPTDLTVLITGESGVGKEIFSKIIHSLSARKHNPFIAVNCGAIPEGTIDSELFGHEKGSFTGATDARKGYFEHVQGGTIFLDEIGEMPLGTQARLLRVLETGEFIRVGSSKVMKTDVRVVAATNVELMQLIKRGKFREDLYYRLSTVPIKVSPLRERREDIYLLFRKFAIDFAEKHRSPAIQLDAEAQQLLTTYDWPGNIRELKNIAEQISALASDKLITGAELKHFLPAQHRSGLPAVLQDGKVKGDSNDFSERELLYKLFFDMKKDLNDLKKFIFDVVGNQQTDFSNVKPPKSHIDETMLAHLDDYDNDDDTPIARNIVIDQPPAYARHAAVAEETSLSLADKEKEMIQSALKKHKGRRKDAALDLGISERTLYRKIKEYKIVE